MTDSHDYPDYPDFLPHGVEHERHRKRLPIPDLRFEQTYLKRIQHCIHIVSRRDVDDNDTESEFIASTHVTPLINSSQQVVRMDWAKIVYITLQDQFMMPLLQGVLWGIIGTYYRPFIAYARASLHGSAMPTHPVEGEGVSWLRKSLKRLGFSSITVGPPSF